MMSGCVHGRWDNNVFDRDGMCEECHYTLRDKFAAAALTGLLRERHLVGNFNILTNYAFGIADAMLEAREK